MTIDQAKLTEVYNRRPDLQKVYNPDGTKKNKNDGNPLTLQDWAKTFGVKEEPGLLPPVTPELQAILAKRPDLQAVYNADGTRKNPSDGNPPTLQDWAEKFGTNEEISLDPSYKSLSQYFSDAEIKNMPPDIKTALAAFADVQTKNFEAGKANADINAQTWADAMRTAATDPSIVAKYGDSLKTAIANTTDHINNLAAGYTDEQAATARQQKLDAQKLTETEAAAGRAYSGFRQQAQDRLAADQGDVIRSSKRALQENLNSVVQPFESKYGSAALSQLPTPTIADTSYTPLGLTGSDQFAKEADIKSKATDFYNATVNPTTTPQGTSATK